MDQTKENVTVYTDDLDIDKEASAIRSRIEESQMLDCLKASLGGYTKKSVQEYIRRLKKQQQATYENYDIEIRRILDEKENLANSNADISDKLDKMGQEYRALSNTLTEYKLEGSQYTVQDMVSLSDKVSAMERENAQLREKALLAQANAERMAADLQRRDDIIDRNRQELKAWGERLADEKKESAQQRRLVADVSAALEEQRAQVRHLSEQISEESISQLHAEIQLLHGTVTVQEETIAGKSEQLAVLEKKVQSLQEQLTCAGERAEHLSQTAELLTVRNERLNAANDELTNRINELLTQSVTLISEKARLNVDKQLAERKLSEVRQRLSAQNTGDI